MAKISLKNISKSFGSTEVINNPNLDIRDLVTFIITQKHFIERITMTGMK